VETKGKVIKSKEIMEILSYNYTSELPLIIILAHINCLQENINTCNHKYCVIQSAMFNVSLFILLHAGFHIERLFKSKPEVTIIHLEPRSLSV